MSTGGVITGFNFVPGAAATMTSPTSVPLHLLALEQAAKPGTLGDLAAGADSAGSVASDAQLRAVIVNVAGYYLRLSQTRTPAQMEALIWDNTSSNGVDHGPSCAAFASLTLELAAQAVGQQSWVSGGSSYPYPLPEWADVRVDTNPDSPAITSMVADAQAHERWHALGDGYQPRPGDWVLFSGHVEVITGYHDGVLDTIGADSLPGLTVNAHSFGGSFAAHGVEGFIDNGNLKPSGTTVTGSDGSGPAATPTARPTATPSGHAGHAGSGSSRSGASGSGSSGSEPSASGAAIIPGIGASQGTTGTPGAGSTPATGSTAGAGGSSAAGSTAGADAIPGTGTTPGAAFTPGVGAIPGVVTSGGTGGASGSGAAKAPSGSDGHRASPGKGTASAPKGAKAGLAAIPGVTGTPVTTTPRAQPAATVPTATRPGGAHHTAPTAPEAPTSTTTATPTATPTAAPTAAPTAGSPTATPASSPASSSPASSGRRYATPGTRDQQAFISLVAPGAMAAQQRYGVPAAVTIAQAIEESAWGRSGLAAQYHNLFGIKGNGPAGSVSLPTSEFQGGQWVSIDAQFRVYHNDAESIADHAELLATSGYYTRAMADRGVPDAFANDLTGVYATDPEYGANLIALMRLYNLYQFDSAVSHGGGTSTHATAHATHAPVAPTMPSSPTSAPTVTPTTGPTLAPTTTPSGSPTVSVQGTGIPGTGVPTTGSSAASRASTPAAHPTATRQGRAGRTGHAGAGRAQVPGVTTPALSPTVPAGRTMPAGSVPAGRGAASRGRQVTGAVSRGTTRAGATAAAAGQIPGLISPGPLAPAVTAIRYEKQFPNAVTTAYFATAKTPLARGEQLYRDVAARSDIPWKLLAAVDWMQCKADPRYSPVHGERLGSLNADGTSFATKSSALTQCASDLVQLAAAVYGIDLTARRPLSVRALADAFAAFRWGALLRRHGVSAMEFPYSVAGLTAAHQKMHWPGIDDPDAPDRPGARFREPFGAVPVVLSLGYPATVLVTESRSPVFRFIIWLARRIGSGHDSGPGQASSGTQVLPGQLVTVRLADASAADRGAGPAGGGGTGGGNGAPGSFEQQNPTIVLVGQPGGPQPPRRNWFLRLPRWLRWTAIILIIGLFFRRIVAWAALAALSAALHLFGANVHLPHVTFGWPWSSPTSSSVLVGPLVLQKIEGIDKPALGTTTFSFLFTHSVNKPMGFLPCWYSATFYAVGHASATVDLNPGSSWWKKSTGHYVLRVLSKPSGAVPGKVSVTMALPLPQLPQTVHDVSVDDTISKPVSSDHSWTYPGLACGVLIKPQFSQSVLYSQAQTVAFQKATQTKSVTQPLIAAAEKEATTIIGGNFITPTLNALNYKVSSFTIRWVAPGTGAGGTG